MIFSLLSTLPAFFVTQAVTTCKLANQSFFFLPPWWEYLPTGEVDGLGVCSPTIVFPDGILPIGLAVLDMLLRLAGFIAVISIIIAGVQHIFSGGDVQKAASARKRIWNSFIGLAIVMVATLFVTFVGRQIGG